MKQVTSLLKIRIISKANLYQSLFEPFTMPLYLRAHFWYIGCLMKALIFILSLFLSLGAYSESKSTEEAKEAICTKLCDWKFMKQATPEEVQKLIDEGHDVNGKDDLEATTLFYSDSSEVAQLLIKNGVDVNAKETHRGNTLLHELFEPMMRGKPSFEHVKVLLENGADPNIQNNDGETPTHLFARSTFFRIHEKNEKGSWIASNLTDEGYKMLGLLVFYGADLTIEGGFVKRSVYHRLRTFIYLPENYMFREE